MSFGRKGVSGAPTSSPAQGFGRAPSGVRPARQANRAPPSAASPPPLATPSAAPSASGESAFAEPGSDLAAQREAFIAAERARRMEGADYAPAPSLAGSASSAIPARRIESAGLQSQERPQWNPSEEAAQVAQRSRSSGAARGDYWKPWGRPDERSMLLAYVFWWFGYMFSLHRFYCGDTNGAIYQIAAFGISCVCLFIFPVMGIVGLVAWFGWVFLDVFFIPGMMRRQREAWAMPDHRIFE